MGSAVFTRVEKILRETPTPYLVDEEREVLARFLARLESECGDAIRRVILYGSKARGDADAESDTDLLVVVSDDDAAKCVRRAEDKFISESDAPIGVLIATEENYRRFQYLKYPIYVNIRRDGVELWDPVAWAIEQLEVPLDFVEGAFRQMDQATREFIRQSIDTAHWFWQMALRDQKDGFLRAAVSRAFYAVFHAASAALYAVNVVRGKHRGVDGAISQFLVKPGLIEPEYHKMYSNLMRGRIISDYGGERNPETGVPDFKTLPDAAMEQMLQDAERFIARMEQFLRERGAIE